MPSIRPISLKKFKKFLLHIGCTYIRKKGSHLVYDRDDLLRPVIMPDHGGEVSASIIRSNLRTLRIDPEQYLEILRNI